MLKTKILVLLLTVVCFTSIAQNKHTLPKNSKQTVSEPTQTRFYYYYFDALRLKDEGKLDQALELFQLCTKIDSTDAACHFEVGAIYSIYGLRTEAINSLEKAINYDPSNWWYNGQLIALLTNNKLYRKGEEKIFYQNVVKALDRAIQLKNHYPNKPDVYRILGSLYTQLNQLNKAIDAYNNLERITEVNLELSITKYQLYLMLNKPKNAFQELDKIVKKYPYESKYKVLLADQYFEQNQEQKAFNLYQDILKTEPNNPFVFSSLANFYKKNNNPKQTKIYIQKALRSEDMDFKDKTMILKNYIESSLKDSSSIQETESLIKLLIEKHPLEEDIHVYYGSFLDFRKRKNEAIQEFETMISINPKNINAWINLLLLAEEEKNFNNIKLIAERALSNITNNSLLYIYGGIGNFKTSNFDKAIIYYKKALELLTPENDKIKSDVYEQLGDVYYTMNDKQKCFENYEYALKADPNNVSVMNNFAYYLCEEKKDLKQAERLSAKTVEKFPNNSTFLDTYAWILFQQANYSLAKYYIERAIENIKDEIDGVIFEHYGDILWIMKIDDEKALSMWQKAYNAGIKSDILKQKIDNKGWKRD